MLLIRNLVGKVSTYRDIKIENTSIENVFVIHKENEKNNYG